MASIEITLEFPGGEDAINRLIRASQRLRPVFASFGKHLLEEVEERFRTQTDPDGQPWVDLKPATWRRKKNNKILTETTRLRGSFSYEATDAGLELGTPVVYAPIHQFGGQIEHEARQQELFFKIDPRTGRPGRRFVKKERSDFAQMAQRRAYTVEIEPRPFLGITDNDVDYFVNLVGDHLRSAWEAP